MFSIFLLLPLTLVAADPQDYEYVLPQLRGDSARYLEQFMPQISAGLDAAKVRLTRMHKWKHFFYISFFRLQTISKFR